MTRLSTGYKKYLTLLIVLGLLVSLSGCVTDRLITRKNQDANYDYCWMRITETKGDATLLNQRLDREITHYQNLTEEVLVAREQALKLTNWITNNIDRDIAIPPSMQDKLNIGMTRGLELSDKVVAVMARNECWLQADEEEMARRGLPELDPYTRFKGFTMALSATLMLYDTYFTTASILNKHDRIRQFLNQEDLGYARHEDQLEAVTDTMFNLSNVSLVAREIQFFESEYPNHDRYLSNDDKASYLTELIKQSPAYPVMQDYTLDDAKDQKEILAHGEVKDDLSEFKRHTVNGISKIFGNLVGLVEERKGKLYEDKNSHAYLSKNLKAGDILLEKTPFRLTDKMIPGHWGHAAIWVGSEKELKELGIWNNPWVKKYHKEISNDRFIVEALRSGVEINSLANFMNVDDVAIIRDPDRTKQQTAARIIRSLRQIGKEYDFNFNVETTDKIVCSQLVYLAYTEITWPTERMLGRYTISPDNVAHKAAHSGPLELIVFYHDGKRIDKQPVKLMEDLMRQK